MQTKVEDFQQQLLDLEMLLIYHDKWWDYQEEGSPEYHKGKYEWNNIQSLSSQLKIAGYAEEVQELFNKYY